MSEDTFPIPEEILSVEIGVPRALVRQWRRGFEEDKDWALVEGQVRLSHEMATRARAHFAPEPPTPARKERNGWEVCVVTRANVPNPSLVLAVPRGADGAPSTWRKVKVQSNRLYRPGMEIAVRHAYGEMWTCIGNPDLADPADGPQSPRWPGRW